MVHLALYPTIISRDKVGHVQKKKRPSKSSANVNQFTSRLAGLKELAGQRHEAFISDPIVMKSKFS
jgi:hypothetical protein